MIHKLILVIFIKFADMFLSNVLYHRLHACVNIDLQVEYILRGLIYCTCALVYTSTYHLHTHLHLHTTHMSRIL